MRQGSVILAAANLAAIVFIAFAQQPSASFPELVIKNNGLSKTDTSNLIHRVNFDSRGSIVVIGSQSNRSQVWTIGPEQSSAAFSGNYMPIRAAQWISNREYLVTSSPQQMIIWDVKRGRRSKEIKTATIDGFPLACHSGGICAWEDSEGQSRAIRIQNPVAQANSSDLPLGNDVALDLDISPNGRRIAAAVNRAVVRIWSLPDGKEMLPLQLQAAPDDTTLARGLRIQQTVIQKTFVLSTPGTATVVRFSPDGKTLAAANEKAIHIFNLDGSSKPVLLQGHKGQITSLAFDVTGSHIFSSGEDKTIRVWQPQVSEQDTVVAQLTRMPTGLSVQPSGKIIAACFPGGDLELWNVEQRKLLVKITFLDDEKGWIAITPEGLFETSEGAWQYAAWRFRDRPRLLFPIELFYRNSYRPGLVADLLEGMVPRLPDPIDQDALKVPIVKIEAIGSRPAKAEMIPGVGISQTPEVIRFRIEARPSASKGKVVDLGIAHNRTVVRKWPGELQMKNGVVVQEVELQMLPTDNRVTAFAFNQKGVRSIEAVWERKMQSGGYATPQRTLYVVAIGVSRYKNSRFNLDFAAADAELVEKALYISESELQQMRGRLTEWVNKRSLEMLGGTRMEEMPATVKITKITNEQATRKRILQAIAQVVQNAGPNDAVLIFYSGHGISDGYKYYLLPYDMDIKSGPDDRKINQEVRQAASTMISAEDLEEVFLPLNVAYAALILDACQSGQVLEGSDLRGPMNPGDFARLAYEKGMYLLAASETQRPANELEQIGHSLLTYALFHEGLQQRKADALPLDGRIELREWLAYGAGRVQTLLEEKAPNKVEAGARPAQRARFAPRPVQEGTALVLYTGEKEP